MIILLFIVIVVAAFALTRKYDHITPVLIDIHWLPVTLRIRYKLLLLIYKCLHTGEPSYFVERLTPYVPARTLRSSNENLLKPVCFKLESYGKRSFKVIAPMLWNELPHKARSAETLDSFKRTLKEDLFKLFIKSPHEYM